MLENFRDEFLVKDEIYGSEIYEGAQMHFKQPPPKESEFYTRETTPNPNKFFYDLMGQNFSVLNTVLEDSDDELMEAQYTQEYCGNITQTSQKPQNTQTSQPSKPIKNTQNSQSQVYIVNKNYHKGIINHPQTHFRYKMFALKLLSHLFEVPLNSIQPKANDESSHQIVKVDNETQIVPGKGFYDFESFITMKIWSQGKKADPHESIFKTLTRRIKVLYLFSSTKN